VTQEELLERVSALLAEVLSDRGWRAPQLAKALGISTTAVYALRDRRIKNPSLEVVVKLVELHGSTTLDERFGAFAEYSGNAGLGERLANIEAVLRRLDRMTKEIGRVVNAGGINDGLAEQPGGKLQHFAEMIRFGYDELSKLASEVGAEDEGRPKQSKRKAR
jgi:hypothetical protein